MVSILIPVFNYDCSLLVANLIQQGDALKAKEDFDYEIILADDHSTQQDTIKKNISTLSSCKQGIYLSQNTQHGRARNRNSAIRIAKGDFIIFIDCDAQIPNGHFLENYWNTRHLASIIVGGIINPTSCPQGSELRFKYEKNAEKFRALKYRTENPYKHFSTFNFMAQREILGNIMFNQDLTEYGYEDTLLGLELHNHNISIAHIENPLIHLGINNNQDFLKATEAAMRNLYKLPMLHSSVGPSRFANIIEKFHLKQFFSFAFALLRKPIRHNLLSHHPSLFLFNIYKVGYYCLQSKQKTSD